MNVRKNFEIITREIAETCEKVGRNTDEVNLIAVTKYVTDARVDEAIEAGITDFAENRPQNYVERKNNYSNKTWHLIGSLQTRKVRDVINEVDYFHALDRDSLAKEIEKRADKEIKCFVQVNVSGEESKHGLTSEEAIDYIKSLGQYSKIKVVGLMTMAPFVEDEDVLRNCFRKLRKLRDIVKELNLSYAPCEFLSMGMSNDYKIAIEEGATHIRVGTALVGCELK